MWDNVEGRPVTNIPVVFHIQKILKYPLNLMLWFSYTSCFIIYSFIYFSVETGKFSLSIVKFCA
jgi:hypothetical protein